MEFVGLFLVEVVVMGDVFEVKEVQRSGLVTVIVTACISVPL